MSSKLQEFEVEIIKQKSSKYKVRAEFMSEAREKAWAAHLEEVPVKAEHTIYTERVNTQNKN